MRFGHIGIYEFGQIYAAWACSGSVQACVCVWCGATVYTAAAVYTLVYTHCVYILLAVALLARNALQAGI